MEINLTDIIVSVLGLCGTLITAYLVPYIKKSLTGKQQQNLTLLVNVAVQAAESLFGSDQGAQKKQYVLDYLGNKGVKVDDAQIEAAVYDLINSYKVSISGDEKIKIEGDTTV